MGRVAGKDYLIWMRQGVKTAQKRNPKIRLTDLERPEGPDSVEQAAMWLRLHSNKIMTVLLVILAAGALYFMLRARGEMKLQQATDAYFAAMQNFEKGLDLPYGSPERVKAMEDVAAQAEAVVSEFSGTPVARMAVFLKGNAFLEAGDSIGSITNASRAITAFTEYEALARAAGDGIGQASALMALAAANENVVLLIRQSDPEEATRALRAAGAAYQRIIDEVRGADFVRLHAMNSLARLHQSQGEDDKAEALYRKVMETAYTEMPRPEGQSSERAMLLHMARSTINSFTAGGTAKTQLIRMGAIPPDSD